MGRVQGKVAIVTGGAGGIGAATARVLAAEGATVVVADLAQSNGASVASEIGGTFIALDVTSGENWNQLVARAEEEHGPIGVLVNNAGIVHNAMLEELTEADYRRVVDVNQVGVFLGMKAVLGSMRRNEGGSIVNISSVGGLIAFPGIMGYVASKWAVRGMTKAAAQELGRDGIRVNSVHPGFVDTAMLSTAATASAGLPIGRPATSEEIAAMVLYLASDESRYSTGSEFVVDGGFTSM